MSLLGLMSWIFFCGPAPKSEFAVLSSENAHMAGWNIHLFEDVFPIENGGFSIAMLVFRSVVPPQSKKHRYSIFPQQISCLLYALWIIPIWVRVYGSHMVPSSFFDHRHVSLQVKLHLVIPGGANQKKHCWNKSLTSMIIHKLHKWSFWRQWSKSLVIFDVWVLGGKWRSASSSDGILDQNDQQTTGWCDATSDGKMISYQLRPESIWIASRMSGIVETKMASHTFLFSKHILLWREPIFLGSFQLGTTMIWSSIFFSTSTSLLNVSAIRRIVLAGTMRTWPLILNEESWICLQVSALRDLSEGNTVTITNWIISIKYHYHIYIYT